MSEKITDLISAPDAYNVLYTIQHPSGGHITKVYVTENKRYSYSPGTELTNKVKLNPEKPEEMAQIRKGIKSREVKLPGTYISRSKVIAEFTKAEVLAEEKDILAGYDLWKEEQANKKIKGPHVE